MIGPVAGELAAAPAVARSYSGTAWRRTLVRAALLVAGFWWLSTGAIFALQRNELTRTLAMVIFSLAGLGAVAVTVVTRDRRTIRAIGAAFLAGGLGWAWVTNALFGGWLVGPPGVVATRPGRSFGLAIEALHATAFAEAAGLGVLIGSALLAWNRPNRTAAVAVLTLWATQQLAKLNIFLGVANPGERFLPEHLAFLTEFFGPPRNSPLLAVSVLFLAGLAILLVRKARRAPDEATRFRHALVASLLTLAAIEHAVLGVQFDLPLWEVFLRMRG